LQGSTTEKAKVPVDETGVSCKKTNWKLVSQVPDVKLVIYISNSMKKAQPFLRN
jgi:hypothetical protein